MALAVENFDDLGSGSGGGHGLGGGQGKVGGRPAALDLKVVAPPAGGDRLRNFRLTPMIHPSLKRANVPGRHSVGLF